MKKVVKTVVLALVALTFAAAISGCFVRTRRRACPLGTVNWRARVRACAHPGVWRIVRVCAANSLRAQMKMKMRFRQMTGRPCAVIVPGSFRRW